ncbi:uncharacterized protein FA14DRAFT_153561 [Meira miltonrushii]|uniref:Uncharacterized protein n=1 Tax=Meira miltonrushii TaxID=1280837 RepID=A0A316VLS6_9BASI|nr:uncharacterized protein FA14DRAFT_153561 [Meira miltonrushii]PWN38234.1 hypothetical protein FA14DRAFT_153561 [Meira miltonrushii]
MDNLKSLPVLNVDTSNSQKLPLDAVEKDETEETLEEMIDQIGSAFDFAQMDVESPLTELRRAFDMLQTSSIFADQTVRVEDEELPPTNDYTQLGPCLQSLKEDTPPVTQRTSRLQTRRPASLCIQDSAKEPNTIIRTPSVPPTTLTFPSSAGSPTGMEANSALLPFYLDPRNECTKRSASNGLLIYSNDPWSSPHVHFSDWSNGENPISSEDDIQSSPAFDNPFCFEDTYAASSCYDDVSRRSSTMQLASCTHSEISSSISLGESGDDILTAPPVLGREWHRGQRTDKKDSYMDVKSQKPSLPRLTPHINAPSNNKRSTMNRGGMRSASATATSTFKNAIRTIKRTTSFYDHGKAAKQKESKDTANEDFMDEAAERDDKNHDQSAKMYGFALTASQKSTKKEGNRKHPNKSPYPPNLSRMPSPTPSSPSVSFHFQSPMMASYFATLG